MHGLSLASRAHPAQVRVVCVRARVRVCGRHSPWNSASVSQPFVSFASTAILAAVAVSTGTSGTLEVSSELAALVAFDATHSRAR
jgi:hypothetical protein